MIACTITVGRTNTLLLRRVLPPVLLAEVKTLTTDSVSGVGSSAPSAWVRWRLPVAVFIDAGTDYPEIVSERQQNLGEYIGLVVPRAAFKMILAVPEIKMVWFHDTDLLSRLLGVPVASDYLPRHGLKPRDALAQLLAQSATIHSEEELIEAVTPQDADFLREAPPFQELMQFLRQAQRLAHAELAAA